MQFQIKGEHKEREGLGRSICNSDERVDVGEINKGRIHEPESRDPASFCVLYISRPARVFFSLHDRVISCPVASDPCHAAIDGPRGSALRSRVFVYNRLKSFVPSRAARRSCLMRRRADKRRHCSDLSLFDRFIWRVICISRFDSRLREKRFELFQPAAMYRRRATLCDAPRSIATKDLSPVAIAFIYIYIYI